MDINSFKEKMEKYNEVDVSNIKENLYEVIVTNPRQGVLSANRKYNLPDEKIFISTSEEDKETVVKEKLKVVEYADDTWGFVLVDDERKRVTPLALPVEFVLKLWGEEEDISEEKKKQVSFNSLNKAFKPTFEVSDGVGGVVLTLKTGESVIYSDGKFYK